MSSRVENGRVVWEMCARGEKCARGVGNVPEGWGMCPRGSECARGVGNVGTWWRMWARGGECARGVGNVRAGRTNVLAG